MFGAAKNKTVMDNLDSHASNSAEHVAGMNASVHAQASRRSVSKRENGFKHVGTSGSDGRQNSKFPIAL